MSGETYLQNILNREELRPSEELTVKEWRGRIESVLKEYFGYMARVYYAGSYGKKTVNRSQYDLDIVIYLPRDYVISLKDMFYQTSEVLKCSGYQTYPKRVAHTYRVNDNFHIDIVPGRAISDDFICANLYDRKSDTSLRTSVKEHINAVKDIRQEVRLLKLWNHQKNLHIKSFILEQLVKRALESNRATTLDQKLFNFFDYVKKNIENLRLLDPANSNNNLGEELVFTQRSQLKAESEKSLSATHWSDIIA